MGSTFTVNNKELVTCLNSTLYYHAFVLARQTPIFYFIFFYWDIYSTRVSPSGISQDIYILVYSFFLFLLVVAVVQLWGVCESGLIFVGLAACGN